MTSHSLHAPPDMKSVRRHQVDAVGHGIRREGMVFVAILGAVWIVQALVALQARTYSVHNASIEYAPAAAIPMWWIAAFAPLAVWRGEERLRRMYLWSMPVDTTISALLKVFAGWIWVMAAVAVYLIFMNLITLTNGLIAGDWPYSSARWWEWVVPFTAATITYLLGSALVVGSKYPVRWLAGIVAALWAIPVVIAMFHAWSVEDLWGMMWSGWGGVTVVLSARWTVERMQGQPVSLTQWSASTALWLGAATLILWLAARRRPEA
jgi:hypothetical protein